MERLALIYDRTSGDEDSTGQDVRAGASQLASAVAARGWTPLSGYHLDEGVPGDTSPFQRRGWREAVGFAQHYAGDGVCVIAVREFSRFSRQEPAEALLEFKRFSALGLRLLCIAEPHFSTAETPDPEDGPDEAVYLMRFVTAWKSWSEKRATRRRVAAAMAEITAGRRETKSGRPPGRPEKKITAEERAWCRDQLAQGASFVQVHRGLLRLRGYFDVTTKEAQQRRFIGRTTLQAILAEPNPADNRTLPKTP